MDLLKELQVQTGMGVLLISHDLALVAEYSDRIAVMYAGQIVESGSVAELNSGARHPYTRALVAAAPSVYGPAGRRLRVIRGQPPDLANIPPGCAFHPRCEFAEQICRDTNPSARSAGTGTVRCHLFEELPNVRT